jgi:hypothetical protein
LRPHQGLGQGEGGEQREEERGEEEEEEEEGRRRRNGGRSGGRRSGRSSDLERSSFSQFGACMLLPCKMQALKPKHSLCREACSERGASCWDGSLSPFLLADLSLFFPFSQCHYCRLQNSLQITRNYI